MAVFNQVADAGDQAAVAAVAASINEFNPTGTISGVGLPPGIGGFGIQQEGTNSYPWCFWRKVDGWITEGQTAPVEYLKRYKKGEECLERYGHFFLNTKGGPYNIYRGYDFILRAGGAKEFAPPQIVELGWYRNPPKFPDANGVLKPVVFPQMVGVKVYEERCPTCNKTLASLNEADARLQLQKHESVRHSTTSSQNELGRIISDATSGTMAPVNAQMADALKAIGGALTALSDRQQAQDERFAALLERLVPQVAEPPVQEQNTVGERTPRSGRKNGE